MSNEQVYLPSTTRDRLQDLMKSRGVTQSDLAAAIGCSISMLSRFISGQIDKLSDENIIRIAKFFNVSTDFILGVVDEPDRKNYDISELGLSVQAAKNLYSGKVNSDVLNLLLTNQRFADVTYLIARYLNNDLAKGVAGLNSVFNVAGAYLAGQAKEENTPALMQGARDAKLLKMPIYQMDVTTIQNTFMQAVNEIKKEHGADDSDIKEAQALTKELMQEFMGETGKGHDKPDLAISSQEASNALFDAVAASGFIDPDILENLRKDFKDVFDSAAENAKKNGVPYGILITTTPGDLTTREGQFADHVRTNATQWNEIYYDKSYDELMALIASNTKSDFMHIRYTYQMLGKGPEYFQKMCKDLQQDWTKIRREVMLEWAKTADNSPFNREDLDIIGAQVKEEPRYTLLFGKAGQFQMKFWSDIPNDSMYPPIIGVDVSSGIMKDASAITVIDSQTTKVIATMKSNFITMPELADVIFQFVSSYAKNAIVNIENNGGFGSSVLQMLIKTSIKPNLYYEIKERINEETFDGNKVNRKSRLCKVYGSTSSGAKRNQLIELLHQRVQHHRDKFLTKDLYDELCTMVVKPNGKVEHADDAHDDLIFSYLWALYVFYYGKDLATRFHLMKTEIFTDDHYDETSYSLEEEYEEGEQIDPEIFRDENDSEYQVMKSQKDILKQAKSISLEDYYKSQEAIERKALFNIQQTPYGREAISKAYHVPVEYLEKQNKLEFNNIVSDITNSFYSDDDMEIGGFTNEGSQKKDNVIGNLANMFKRL